MHLAHAHIPFNRIPEYISFILKNRLDLEIYFSSDVLDTISVSDIKEFKARLDYNPAISFHAPFMDMSPGAVDSKVRKATMDRFSSVLDIAEVLHPKAIVFHSGYEKWKYALKVDIWLEQSLLTWVPLNERASSIGTKIAVENIFEDDPSSLMKLMEQMNSANFGVCFDVGHFNLFSSVPLETWMRQLNPYITELHLHDNDTSYDQHLPMGEGTFDFKKFFGLLQNKDCVYTIEAHTPENVMKSMEYLKKIKGAAAGS